MIGIFCGKGEYPNIVIDSCIRNKIQFCLVFIDKYDFRSYPGVPKIVFQLGQVGKVLSFLKKNRVKQVIFAGHVQRPSIFSLRLDLTGFRWLLKLCKHLCVSGDDTLLRAISKLMKEEADIEMMSGTDVFPHAFLEEGIYSKRQPTDKELEDIELGIRESQVLGIKDIGQSIVVSNNKVIAREDSRGTDALIDKCFEGILVKTSKPQQDVRMDLPVIGEITIENLHRHGFKGLVIEANRTIILNREKVLQKVDEYGLFLQSVQIRKAHKVFIVAGESSGDYLGARLIKDLKKIDSDIEFVGIGGPCMEEAGLINLCSISKLSIIGIKEVFGKIWEIKNLINETVDTIINYEPEVLITIDSSGFTHRIDKLVKKKNPNIPIVHYVSPPVWAWRTWRAKKLHTFIDKLLVLLPFEQEFLSNYPIKTAFVGHPIASDDDLVKDKSLQAKDLTITLLPGSRPSEIDMHMPILKKFAELMIEKHPEVRFYLPTVKTVAPLIKKYVQTWKYKPIVSTKKMKKVKAYSASHVAVSASGTVVLELAKVGLPFVTIYKTSYLTYLFVKWLIKVPYVCLINILAGKPVVPELLQNDCSAERIFDEVENLLNTNEKKQQLKEFTKIIDSLKVDRIQAAKEVYEFIKSHNASIQHKK